MASCPLPVWGLRGWRPACPGSWGASLCRGGFGRSIQDFWFRTFPLHSEKEGRKGGMEGGGGGSGEGEEWGKRRERREPFHTSYVYFWRNRKGFFIQHKTVKQKRSFFSSHNTNFSWSPGVIPRNSESRGSRWPSALRRREEGRRDPTDHTTYGLALRQAPCWHWPGAGSRTGQPPRRTDRPCSRAGGCGQAPADQAGHGAFPQALWAHPGKF